MTSSDQQIKLIQDDGRVFVDMPDGDDHVCASCGACCNHFRVSFYVGEIAGGLAEDAIGVPADKVIPITPFYAAMAGTNQEKPRCVCFEGEVGKSSRCSIYHHRSSTCREFYVHDELGQPNPACQTARAANGLPPLIAIQI
jgi:Fe-S-cluster containining protein